ncbi:Farnesyl pyrophosphate synthase [Ectocarpus siliculosus]|uniref:Farnesyl pyrophosphate synthase n=1 Tax=Ectocarpus siliculosus TaxID=2880 RepID=D8LGP5_ECTSI|nr:Farnesyl pyrophosphate synthase [Ectocarpus siliculosus]|eukprot:CBN75787.1 Farnesyl pyrophosphate synthase [Ectocarpus siliculosus]
MESDGDFPQEEFLPKGPGATDEPFADQASEILDQAWPVILVVGAMMAVQWGVTLYFGAATASGQVLPIYLTLAAGGAAYFLYQEENIGKAWECFCEFDELAKYAFAVLAVAFSYALARVSPGSSKGSSGASSSSGQGLAVEDSALVVYPRELPGDPKKSFEAMHKFLVEELVADVADNYEGIPAQLDWIQENLEYNTKGGKMNRGMGVVDVLRAFAEANGRELRHEEVCRGSILGWCVEWLQAFFLVADDVMDRSLTRRGQPCWYKVPKVQEIAINDSFILEAHVFKMLKRHFAHENYYLQLVELFHDVTYRTEMGQLLDLTSQPMDAPSDLTRFTPVRYRMIVRYKTAYYTFYLPCAIGMIYAGVKDPASYRLARDICCRIGEFFQIQDDYLDCFGDPEVIGKVGTDIQDNKCSWLVVQALERASKAQKAVLIQNYAIDEEAKIERVKELYRELKLEKVYAKYEEDTHKQIKELIAKVEDIPHAVFHQFIDKIYKRSK